MVVFSHYTSMRFLYELQLDCRLCTVSEHKNNKLAQLSHDMGIQPKQYMPKP